MKVSELFEKIDQKLFDLHEMATGREAFKAWVHAHLNGAFREFICNEIAKKINEIPAWDVEIIKLTNNIKDYISKSKMKGIVSNSEKIKHKAVLEVFNEMSLVAGIVNEAKNKVLSNNYYPTKARQIDFMDFDDDAEFRKFIQTYLPAYVGYKKLGEK